MIVSKRVVVAWFLDPPSKVTVLHLFCFIALPFSSLIYVFGIGRWHQTIGAKIQKSLRSIYLINEYGARIVFIMGCSNNLN